MIFLCASNTPADLVEKVKSAANIAGDAIDMAQMPRGTFDRVHVAVIESPARTAVASLLDLLCPGGTVTIYQPSNIDSDLKSSLKLSGFVNVVQGDITGELASFTAQKPAYDVGATASIKLRPRPAVPVVALSANGDDDDLIDEDALLDESDLVRPAAETLQKPGGCETKKKACKDCSCGRAEMEAQDAAQQQKTTMSAPKSSCGSCYLGDAFRCSGCPYAGMPAFKQGDQVTLPASFMSDDI